jgi:hypothetical protein
MLLPAVTTTHLPGATLNEAVAGENIAVIGVTVVTAVAVPLDEVAAREALVVNARRRSPGSTGTAGLIPLVQLDLPQAAARGTQTETPARLVVRLVTPRRAIGMCPLDQALLVGILCCLAASLAIGVTERAPARADVLIYPLLHLVVQVDMDG